MHKTAYLIQQYDIVNERGAVYVKEEALLARIEADGNPYGVSREDVKTFLGWGDVRHITEEQKALAEQIIRQMWFLDRRPVRFEWGAGIVVDGRVSVNVIVEQRDLDGDRRVDSHRLEVPVEWNLDQPGAAL